VRARHGNEDGRKRAVLEEINGCPKPGGIGKELLNWVSRETEVILELDVEEVVRWILAALAPVGFDFSSSHAGPGTRLLSIRVTGAEVREKNISHFVFAVIFVWVVFARELGNVEGEIKVGHFEFGEVKPVLVSLVNLGERFISQCDVEVVEGWCWGAVVL